MQRLLRMPASGPVIDYPGHSRAGFVRSRPSAVAICHPDWRGIRSVTYAFGVPVVEARDLAASAEELASTFGDAGTALVVISGFPPGAAELAQALTGTCRVRILMHSSMTQHGFEPGEADVISAVADGMHRGAIDALGFTKEGQAEAMSALGVPAVYVPAPTSRLDPVPGTDLGPDLHVGVFAEATWRKNVTTQLGATALLGAVAHITGRPQVSYLPGPPQIVAHGLLDREAFVTLMASVDLNLGVSLYEAYPVLPQESYWLGIPCLMSRTSTLFEGDPILEQLTIVDRFDNPAAIARAAHALLDAAAEEDVVERARAWMEGWDRRTADQRETFLVV